MVESDLQNVLIDFSALKSGGGCQLALNFIDCISNLNDIEFEKYILLLPRTGPLNKLYLKYPKFKYLLSPSDNIFRRIIFEKCKLNRLYKKNSIGKIFTFFGAGLPHPSNIVSIVVVAYPIICYNDSPFWSYLSFYSKFKLKFKNYIRLKRLSKANKILVETPIMKVRISKVLNKDLEEVQFLKPAPSDFVIKNDKEYYNYIKEFKFIVLSGTSPHKNLWRIPELAIELNKLCINFKFVISVSEKDFLKSLKNRYLGLYLNIKDKFSFVGSIHPSEINSFYEGGDFLVSLSDLESFSNNYMEAWKASVPLIVSDRDFSRTICKDSALYIEPHSPVKSALDIYNYISDIELINRRILIGRKLLEDLPDTKERVNFILEYMNNIS
ncbi:MAG: glycosyltransferase [Saprospiraceae bacterium]|nr:glycosyltransferase [Saprospiraceae bacterium]